MGGPSFDFGSKPEVYAALAEIEYGLRHVLVPLVALMDRVAVRESQDLGHPLGVNQVFGCYAEVTNASVHR